MANSIPTNDFRFVALIDQVKQRYGKTLSTKQDYEFLSDDILSVAGQYINADTLRRFTGSRKDRYNTCRRSTADILAQYTGAPDWTTFAAGYIASQGVESDVKHSGRVLKASDCEVGQTVALEWLPDRRCVLKYTGDMRWEVVEAENSHTIQAGDTFVCAMICEDETLFGESLMRNGNMLGSVRLGLNHGVKITTDR